MIQIATVAPYIVFAALLAYFLLLWIKPIAISRFHSALPARFRGEADVRVTRIVGVCGVVFVFLFMIAWIAK